MNKAENLKKYIQSLDGYKISNTHFRIGSKVHSADFFYAKRLFQNSYYTSRIAILLAIKIKDQLSDLNKPLTLIGYELYSELLLGLIKKFLTDFGYKQINHFVTRDLDEKIEHIPSFIEPYKNAVIIVPIASTGSTAVKIEEYIKSIHSDINFFSKHYNIIIATDTNIKFLDITKQTNNQLSFIQLNANWQNPSNCEWCFKKSEYRPLFETDKSSLTPALIFGLPLAKMNEDSLSVKFEKINFENALIYRKAKRNNEHFLFSTNTDILIKDNQKEILSWLKKLKGILAIKPIDKFVIISPCHYSNSLFINLVNEQLFHSSATIIHHQTGVDYLSNFKLLNHRFLSQSGAKIFFIDDSLISGGTFFRIYDLLRYTLNYNDEKKLSGAIFLSDKSSPDIHKRVSRATNNNIFSFLKVNLPVPPRIFGKKPLEHEIKRYDDLSQMVLHDVLKKTYYLKAEDLNGNELPLVKDVKEKRLRHEKMFRATHKIYEYYGSISDIQKLSFNDLLEKIGFNKSDIEDRMAVMKVLSQYPFLLYMPVRKMTFEWHCEWFNEKIEKLNNGLNNSIPNYTFSYNDFREFKFLIRRAVFLGHNGILFPDFFNLIRLVFHKINNPINQSGLFQDISIENTIGAEKKNLEDFHLYLLRQYLEMIQKNGWCAVKIMGSIKQTESQYETIQGGQFIRMLKIESAIVLNEFYTILSKREDWCKLYKYGVDGVNKNEEIIIDENNDKVSKFLNNSDFIYVNKFEVSNEVLGLKIENNLNKQFLSYLWIKQFLSSDQKYNISNISLINKTESIFLKLKRLFIESDKIGAFFIVTDGKDIPHLVYDKDTKGNRLIKEIDNHKHNLLLKFLQGETDGQNIDNKTIIEYEKTADNKWNDLYTLKQVSSQNFFSAECKWLLLIRISSQFPVKKKEGQYLTYRTLGLMGFYSDTKQQNDLLAKQLLMLLKKDIGNFIRKHHKNDEFSILREAEIRSRFAYLAGHGRQMIQKLAKDDNDTFGNVVTTMEKLQYLFATKWISYLGNTRLNKEDLNKDLIRMAFPYSKIDKNVIENILKIGKKVFLTDTIENKVELQQDSEFNSVNDDFIFRFYSEILTFICFELFINAKKNRFHFIGETCSTCNTNTNSLGIKFEIKNGKLVIEIKGTGISVPENVKNEINDGIAAMKLEHEIAGLNLIYKLIKSLDNRNQLSINKDIELKPCSECGIQKNTIKIELNQIAND